MKATTNGTQTNVVEDNQSLSYPFHTFKSSMEMMETIANRFGTGTYQNKKEIAKELKLMENTLATKLSACVAYGLLDNQKGQGYKPTVLFEMIHKPTTDEEKETALITALLKPTVFNKLKDEFKGKMLPSSEGFINHLGRNYKLVKSSAFKVAGVFLTNARDYNLIDVNSRFNIPKESKEIPPPPPPPDQNSDGNGVKPPIDKNLFSYTIPLTGSKIAILSYPKDRLTRKDIEAIKLGIAVIEIGLKIEENESGTT
jgi:hypothetical protein